MNTLLVAGDLYAPEGSIPSLDSSLAELLANADYSIVNMEGPIAGFGRRITKSGPCVSQDPLVPGVLRDFGFDGVTLANNHIFDYGVGGLVATVDACEASGLDVVGVNLPNREAIQHDIELGSVPITIVNACEEEWVRSQSGLGANAFSLPSMCRAIAAVTSRGRRAVVVLHGGNEYFPFPNPALRDDARFMIESGASAVLMHHSHVVAAMEVWQGRPIAYGLGNFDFKMSVPAEGFTQGVVAQLEFAGDGSQPTLSLIGTTFDALTGHVQLAQAGEQEAIQWRLRALSEILASETSYAAHWREFVDDRANSYVQLLRAPDPAGRGLASRVAAQLATRATVRTPAKAAALLNVLRCDSHRAVAVAALSKLLDES